MASRPDDAEEEVEELADCISPHIPGPFAVSINEDDDFDTHQPDPTSIPLVKFRHPVVRRESSWYPEDYGSDEGMDGKTRPTDSRDANINVDNADDGISPKDVEASRNNDGDGECTHKSDNTSDPTKKPRVLKAITPYLISEDKPEKLYSEDKAREYRRHLDGMQKDLSKLRAEIHLIVRKNQSRKLKWLCEFLNEQYIDLSSEELRGDEDETVLCLAVVKKSEECAKLLVDFGGRKLIKKYYTKTDFTGATALHLAILKQDLPIIEYIMNKLSPDDRSELLHQEATGGYFREIYKCACKPLTLAAAVGKMEIFNSLVKYGADLWTDDTGTGNTVMHNLALLADRSPDHAIRTMDNVISSEAVTEWWNEKKEELLHKNKDFVYGDSLEVGLLKAENANGDTPFTSAASVGATKFALSILDMRNIYKFPWWNIGPMKSMIYEMNEIDPAVPLKEIPPPPNRTISNSPKRASALESFAYVLDDEKLDFGAHAAIRKAMNNKWKSYRFVFYTWMVIHLIVMICFTVSVKYRVLTSLANSTTEVENTRTQIPDAEELNVSSSAVVDVLLDSGLSATDKGILALECFVLIISIFYLILELVDFGTLLVARGCSAKGSVKLRIPHILLFDIFRLLLFLFSLSVVIALFLRIARSPWQDMAYAVAAICGWSFMLFFTRANKNIGIFTIMLQRMITRELAYFAVVFLAIMCGFGTATYCLFQESTHVPDEVASVHQTLFSHFRLLIGLEEFNIAEESRLPWLVKLVFMVFVLLTNILLLNMLIAAMNNTYTQMDNLKELLWLKMRTKAVLMIERRIPRKIRPKSNLEKYGREKQWFIGTREIKARHPLAGGLL